MTRETVIAAPSGYPFFGWSKETTKAYLLAHPLSVGDKMIIYNSHGGLHTYMLALVVNPIAGPRRAIVLSRVGYSGGPSFYRSGINTVMPKGKTYMLPVVASLMEQLTIECDVVLDLVPHA